MQVRCCCYCCCCGRLLLPSYIYIHKYNSLAHHYLPYCIMCFLHPFRFCHFSLRKSFKSEFFQFFFFFFCLFACNASHLNENEWLISLWLIDLRHCVWRYHLLTSLTTPRSYFHTKLCAAPAHLVSVKFGALLVTFLAQKQQKKKKWRERVAEI